MAIRRFDNIPISQGPARGALAMAMVNPLEDTLSAIEKFGQRGAVADATQQATNDVLSGGNPGMSLGLTPAGQAYNEAAQKAYETRTSLDLRAKHAELSARYTGQNPGDAQAYAETMGQYVSAVGAAVPDSVKPRIMAEAHLRYAEGLASVTEATNRHQYALNVSEMQAGYKASVDDAAGLAMAGKPDLADAALLQSLERADNLVAIGAKSPGEGEMMKREARATVAAGTLYQGFLAGHVSIDAVEKGDIGADLPGHIRESLVRQMQTEQAHQRSEQNHALAVQAATERANGNNARALAKDIASGAQITPEKEATANLLLSGKAPIDPEAYNTLREAYSVRSITQPVTSGKVADAQAALLRVDAYQPKDATEAAIREKSRKEIEGFIADATGDDPIGKLAARGGSFPNGLPPVDLSSPEALAQSLVTRSAAVAPTEIKHGVPLPVLSKSEAAQLGVTLSQWSEDQQAQALGAVSQLTPEAAAKTLEGVGKTAPVMAHAGYLQMQGAGELARSVLRGAKVTNSDLVKPATDLEKANAVWTSEITQVMPPAVAKQTLAAAEAVRADFISRGEDPPALADIIKSVGGATGTYGSGKVLLPFGVTDEGDFADRIESVTDAEVIAMGGAPEHAKAIREGRATLRSVGDGRYLVRIGPNIMPFELDYSAIAPKPAAPGIFGTTARALAGAADVGMENFKATMATGALDPSGR